MHGARGGVWMMSHTFLNFVIASIIWLKSSILQAFNVLDDIWTSENCSEPRKLDICIHIYIYIYIYISFPQHPLPRALYAPSYMYLYCDVYYGFSVILPLPKYSTVFILWYAYECEINWFGLLFFFGKLFNFFIKSAGF